MELACGIDLGTSYFKVGLFDRAGSLVGLGRVPVRTTRDRPGRCELTVESFWYQLRTALQDAIAQSGQSARHIKAIGYSTQANSFTLLDANNSELIPLILWTDTRVEKIPSEIESLFNRPDFASTTGLGLAPEPGFAVAKLRWIQSHQPATWSQAVRFLTISSYFVYKLTGNFAVDEGSSSLLGIYDVSDHQWWPQALAAAGLSAHQLPQPVPINTVAGRITPSGARLLGLPENIPLVIGSLDHYLAALGAGLGVLAELSESTGTVLAAIAALDEFAAQPGCCTLPAAQPDRFSQLAFDSNSAGILEWYQKHFARHLTIQQLDKLASEIPPGSDGLIARPYAHTYPHLEGFAGVSSAHTPGHFARAIMESVAASLLRLIQQMSAPHPRRILATGGGANSDTWLQIKADLIDAEFVRVTVPEPACCGAAMIAALVAGWFDNLSQVSRTWVKPAKTFTPASPGKEAYRRWYTEYQKLKLK